MFLKEKTREELLNAMRELIHKGEEAEFITHAQENYLHAIAIGIYILVFDSLCPKR